jgi:imidazolonepropionase-like amidohydrolase
MRAARLVSALCALAVILLVFGQQTRAADETPTVLQVKLLIDGSGGAPLEDGDIVIVGKRIQAVGKRGALALPKGARVLNFRDKVAIPGLVDAHSHYREWQGEIYLSHGVTTAFDIGDNPLAWRLAQKEGIDKGKITGPRLLVAGRFNRPSGDDGGEEGSRGRTEIYVRSAEEAREEAKKALAAGVDMIKALENFSLDDLRAIAAEARGGARPLITHSINGTEAVLAGIDINSIEHSHSVAMATVGSDEGRKKLHEARTSTRNRMTSQEVHSFMEEDTYDRVIQALVAKKVCWTPTLSTAWRAFSVNRRRFEEAELRLLSLPALAYVPPYFRANTREYFSGTAALEAGLRQRIETGYRKLQDFLRRFVKAGGRLQTGSDPNSILPGLAIQRELEILVEAGLTPQEALVAATRNPAECENRTADFGAIAPGRFADIVILDGNPLEDIFAVERVHTVFKEGAARAPGYNPAYRNPIARPAPDRPAAEIEKLTPDSVVQGEGPVKLSIKGKNFLSTAVVKVNGKAVKAEVQFRPARFPQNFRRATEIGATVPAELLSKAGTYSIVVEHPGIGGSQSDPAYLIVRFR